MTPVHADSRAVAPQDNDTQACLARNASRVLTSVLSGSSLLLVLE